MATNDTPQPAQPAQPINSMQNELTDRSRFIRTMAKDMAALAGAPARPAPVAKPEPKKEEVVSGVALPTREEPFFERPQSRAEKEAENPVALPSLQEAASIVSAPAAPATVTDDRDAILARLRKKVSESAQMSIQPSPAPATPTVPQTTEKSWPEIPTPPAKFEPVPEVPKPAPVAPEPLPPPPPKPEPIPVPEQIIAPPPVQPAWQNVPEPAPAFAPLQESVPSRLPPLTRTPGGDTYREPIEAVAPPRPNAVPAPDRMHTYTSDFSKRIDTQGASTFSVLAAEQDAAAPRVETRTVQRSRNPKALLAVGSGVLLVVLAIGGIIMTYQFVMTMRATPIASLTVPSIVVADEYRELNGTGIALVQSLATTAGSALVPGNVLVTYILESPQTGEEGLARTPAGGAAFLRATQIPAPDILLRNIAKESAVGIVNAGGETNAFFALRVDSYERTYAGMLTWEPLMMRDLALLYPLYPARVEEPQVETASSTASTTPATSTPVRLDPVPAVAFTRFADAVVANHDVRILRDTAGRSLMLYGYADKRTLIIARDEAAFETLLTRLKAE